MADVISLDDLLKCTVANLNKAKQTKILYARKKHESFFIENEINYLTQVQSVIKSLCNDKSLQIDICGVCDDYYIRKSAKHNVCSDKCRVKQSRLKSDKN